MKIKRMWDGVRYNLIFCFGTKEIKLKVLFLTSIFLLSVVFFVVKIKGG